MNRREALRHAMRLSAAAALWAGLSRRTWAALAEPAGWSPAEVARLELIGDTILPATAESPGAGAVGIGRFVATMLNDCHPAATGALVKRWLATVEEASREQYGSSFADLAVGQREAVLLAFESVPKGDLKFRDRQGFLPVKELTLLGYFTSEPGATQALRYDPVPGAYRGSVRLGPGERSWTL